MGHIAASDAQRCVPLTARSDGDGDGLELRPHLRRPQQARNRPLRQRYIAREFYANLPQAAAEEPRSDACHIRGMTNIAASNGSTAR